ncbi:MAG TPA: hypothetical protein VGF63_06370 [Solirubrobacteraceae bacterium]
MDRRAGRRTRPRAARRSGSRRADRPRAQRRRRAARRDDGPPIELEIWELSAKSFGRLVAGVRPPLVIGTVALVDGRAVKGFLCETDAVVRARDITSHGGWRAYLASLVLAPTA